MRITKLHSIVAAAAFIRDNKEELIKNLDAYGHLLSILKKAADDYEDHGLSIVDDPNESDEEQDDADKWLAEHGAKVQEPEKKVYSRDWQPREDYSPKEQEAIKQLMGEGYSHREAERLAGAYRGSRDYRAAMKSGINPSMPSDKMMAQLKELAKEWLDNARSREMSEADEMKNPMKHATGQMEQAHKNHVEDYHKAFSEFLASEHLQELGPRERHQAVQEWKNQWKQENPEYTEGLSGVSAVQTKYADAAQNIKQRNEDIGGHIARGGVSETPEMTDEEAMQHLGAGKNEEGYAGGSIIKDPTAAFAAKNPRYVKLLNQEQMDRVKRVDSAAATQGKVRLKKKPEEPGG